MSFELLLSWATLIIIGNAIPGPDFFFLSSVSLIKRQYGLIAGLGLQTGVICHSIVASLAYLFVTQIPDTYSSTLKVLGVVYTLIGVVYITWLGKGTLTSALSLRKQYKANPEQVTLAQISKSYDHFTLGLAYRRGLLTNLFNPKCLMFMLLVLPLFVESNASFSPALQLFVLCTVNLILGLIHWSLVAVSVNYLATKISSPSIRINLELISGAALIILGLCLLKIILTPLLN